MDFSFTPDQLALRDGVRDALKDLDDAPPASARDRVASLGLTEALLPEERGGLGLDELDVLLGLEETGRAALPVPVVETLVASRLLGGAGAASVALDGSGLVPWPEQAGTVLAGDGTSVRIGGDLEPVASVDPYRPLARVTGGELVELAPGVLAGALRLGALGTAAQLLGLAGRALELTVAYVGERRQFGVPVGSFQAVKHQLADAHLAVELARPLVYAAAWSQVHDTATAVRDVAGAKVRAGDAAALAARAALQCHGAMGYTREYPLHRWLTRIWALRSAWGTPSAQRAVLAAELGLT